MSKKIKSPGKFCFFSFIIIAIVVFIGFISLVGSPHYIETITGLVIAIILAEILTGYIRKWVKANF